MILQKLYVIFVVGTGRGDLHSLLDTTGTGEEMARNSGRILGRD